MTKGVTSDEKVGQHHYEIYAHSPCLCCNVKEISLRGLLPDFLIWWPLGAVSFENSLPEMLLSSHFSGF